MDLDNRRSSKSGFPQGIVMVDVDDHEDTQVGSKC